MFNLPRTSDPSEDDIEVLKCDCFIPPYEGDYELHDEDESPYVSSDSDSDSVSVSDILETTQEVVPVIEDPWYVTFTSRIITIRINADNIFTAHSDLLKKNSKYFRASFDTLLSSNLNSTNEIDMSYLEAFGPANFAQFLRYVYTKKQPIITNENCLHMFQLFNFLQCKKFDDILTLRICKTTNNTNCCDRLNFAASCNRPINTTRLSIYCIRHICFNFNKVDLNKILSVDDFIKILASDCIVVDNEVDILCKISARINQHPDEIEQLENMMQHVRRTLLPPLNILRNVPSVSSRVIYSLNVASSSRKWRSYQKCESTPIIIAPNGSVTMPVFDEFEPLLVTYCKNINTNEFKQSYGTAISVGESIFVVGGHDGKNFCKNVSEITIRDKMFFCPNEKVQIKTQFLHLDVACIQAAVVEYHENIYVFGGYLGKTNNIFGGIAKELYTDRIECFNRNKIKNPVSFKLDTPSCGFDVNCIDDKLYVIGGCNRKKSCIRYCPGQSNYESIACLPCDNLIDYASIQINECFYFCSSTDKHVYMYSVRTNEWQKMTYERENPRKYARFGKHMNNIYLIGGGALINDPYIQIDYFDPIAGKFYKCENSIVAGEYDKMAICQMNTKPYVISDI